MTVMLTLPVVWNNPNSCLRVSSLTAPGASILLPRTKKGTLESCSIAKRAYNVEISLCVYGNKKVELTSNSALASPKRE